MIESLSAADPARREAHASLMKLLEEAAPPGGGIEQAQGKEDEEPAAQRSGGRPHHGVGGRGCQPHTPHTTPPTHTLFVAALARTSSSSPSLTCERPDRGAAPPPAPAPPRRGAGV